MANPIVVDISHHQPDPIDWAKLRSNGTIGVIHKATEGTGYIDPKLFDRMSAAKSAGLLTSTYHFLNSGDPEAQMDFYLKTVNPVKGERMCIDHEEHATLDQLKQAVRRLLYVRPDLQVTIYSGHLIKEQLSGKTDAYLAGHTSLWLAQYGTSKPSWPTAVWPTWSLWQFTDAATPAGIKGDVDGNNWNGSRDGLIAWMSPADQTPVPAPPVDPVKPVDNTVGVAIEVPAGVVVQVMVNGVLLK